MTSSRARSQSERIFDRFPDLEGPASCFEEALGLMKFVERTAFRGSDRFAGFSDVREALSAAVRNLDREWVELGARLADGSTDGSESCDQAVTLLEYIVLQGFEACFEQLFADESDAIHGAEAHLTYEWRHSLYAAILERQKIASGKGDEIAGAENDIRDPSGDVRSGRSTSVEPPEKRSWVEEYWALKEQHPGAILMLRMGDFYEFVFNDAVTVAKATGIVLTQRGRHLDQPIQMCGIPCGTLSRHRARLSAFNVVLCEPRSDGSVGWSVRPAFGGGRALDAAE